MKVRTPRAPKGYAKHFAAQIEVELERNRQARKPPIHFMELAQVSGVSGSTLSRIRCGTQEWVQRDHLEAIINTVSTSPDVRARLQAAWLRDQCVAGCENLVEIKVRKGKAEAALFNPKVQEAFDFLRSMRKRDLDSFILHTARLAGFEADKYRG